MKKIVLDCGTQKGFNEIKDGKRTWDLLMSTAVTFDYDDNQYRFWTYLNKNDLLEYLNGNYIIGYNSITFDCPLLLGEKHKIDENGNFSNDKYQWTNFDLFIEIKKRLFKTVNQPISKTFEAMKKHFNIAEKGVYTLSSVSIATLGNIKNLMKDDSIELFKQKKIIELIQYNLQQTRMIKELYEFLKRQKYIINGNFDIIKF